MDCEIIKSRIADFLSGDLSGKEVEDVLEHLSGCPGCKKEWLLFDSTWKALRFFPEKDPDPAYVEKFWLQLKKETPWYEKVWLHFSFGRARAGLITFLIISGLAAVMAYFSLAQLSIRETEKILTTLSQEDIDFIENMDLAENLVVLDGWDLSQPASGAATGQENFMAPAPISGKWRAISTRQKEEIKAAYKRYQRLSRQEQDRLKANWQRFGDRSPAAKAQVKQRLAKWRALPEPQREEIKQRLQSYLRFPPAASVEQD